MATWLSTLGFELGAHQRKASALTPAPPLLYNFLGRSAVEEWFWFQWFNLLVGLKELMVQLKSCIPGRFFNYNCIALTNAFTPSSNPFPT